MQTNLRKGKNVIVDKNKVLIAISDAQNAKRVGLFRFCKTC